VHIYAKKITMSFPPHMPMMPPMPFFPPGGSMMIPPNVSVLIRKNKAIVYHLDEYTTTGNAISNKWYS
jgi:hypothetical protein